MSRQLFEEARKVLTQEAAVKLDPVGQEDKDVDNDGDADKTDSYLKKRRGAISAAIAKSKNEAALSEEDLAKLKAILGEMKKKEEKEEMEDEEEDEMEDEKNMKNEGMQKAQVPPKGPKPEEVPAYMRKGNARQKFPLDLKDLKKEEVEQTDEAKLNPAGKAAVRDVTKKIGAKTLSQTKAIVALAKLDPKKVKEEVEQVEEASYSAKAARAGKDIGKPGKMFAKIAADAAKRYGSEERGAKVAGAVLKKLRSEETEQEDFELIENLQFNIPETPSYQEYIKAALTIAECKAFSELSEDEQQYIIGEMETAFRNNDVSFIAEAEALSDMNDTVQRLRKAGHKVEDMGRDYKGQPFYIYVDKGTGLRRKVTYKGNQKVTQNMGKAAPEDTNEA